MSIRSGERFIASGDARLCVETFGAPRDRALLLIGGAAASMDFWEDEFCSRLADTGRFVIRYDLRDTGRSTSSPAGSPGYTGEDLVADAIAVLDGVDVAAADVYGVSMGGALAQRVALKHPDRVTGLILQSTTPAIAGHDRRDLPSMEPRLSAAFSSGDASPDWTNRGAAIDAMVDGERMFSGSVPFDAQRVRRVATRSFDRTIDMAAMQTNHWMLDEGTPTRQLLSDIAVPTLVLHGTEDPLFPYPHAEALAAEIRDARLVPLPGMGHQYPPEPLWDLVIEEISAGAVDV